MAVTKKMKMMVRYGIWWPNAQAQRRRLAKSSVELEENPTASLRSLERIVRRRDFGVLGNGNTPPPSRGNDGCCRPERLTEANDDAARQTVTTERTERDAAIGANGNRLAFGTKAETKSA